MTEDMIGVAPRSTQAVAEDFLKTAGPKWESWLLFQSWKIQRRAATEPKHHDSFLGMLAILGWLLHLANRSPIRTEMVGPKPIKKEEKNPQDGVDEFIKGFNTK